MRLQALLGGIENPTLSSQLSPVPPSPPPNPLPRPPTHHIHVGFPIESLGEDGDDEDVDDEGDEERNARLSKEVFVGLTHLPWVGAIHLAGLQGGGDGNAPMGAQRGRVQGVGVQGEGVQGEGAQ